MDMWNKSAQAASEMIISSGGSSSQSSPSSPSTHSGNEQSCVHREASASLLRECQCYAERHVPKQACTLLQDGREHKRSYRTHDGVLTEQTAVVEHFDRSRNAFLNSVHPIEHYNHNQVDTSCVEPALMPTKTTHKKLFGEHGWLGCTADMNDISSNAHRFKGLRGLGRKVIKQVEELVSASIFSLDSIYMLMLVSGRRHGQGASKPHHPCQPSPKTCPRINDSHLA